MKIIKTIFACVDPATYYKVEISDALWSKVLRASAIIKACPFNGQLWLNLDVITLDTRSYRSMRIIVSKDHAGVFDFPYDDGSDLLEYDDNLLTLPDTYTTRRFRIMQDEAEKLLNPDEIRLIRSWDEIHAKTLAEC